MKNIDIDKYITFPYVSCNILFIIFFHISIGFSISFLIGNNYWVLFHFVIQAFIIAVLFFFETKNIKSKLITKVIKFYANYVIFGIESKIRNISLLNLLFRNYLIFWINKKLSSGVKINYFNIFSKIDNFERYDSNGEQHLRHFTFSKYLIPLDYKDENANHFHPEGTIFRTYLIDDLDSLLKKKLLKKSFEINSASAILDNIINQN